MKFKVGDKIRGISDSYSVANRSMTLAEVVGVIERPDKKYGHMDIKIIEHTDKTKIGQVYIAYNLDTDFELVEEKQMSKIDELEMKIKELSEEIERLKAEKENEPWKPKGGEWYWYIDVDVYPCTAKWSGYSHHENRYVIGNVFKTQEEAEFRAEQLKVEAELRRFARPFDEDERNWAIIFDVDEKEITIDNERSYQSCNIHFASEEIAQKAIDTVGEERIKKYYLGWKIK